MRCNTVLSFHATTTTTFSFPPNLTTTTTTTSPSTLSTCTSFPTRPIKPLRSSFKTRATVTEDLFLKPVTQKISFYELLGIPETGTLPEIKRAYKQLARVYHPDVSPPERVKEHTERFIRIRDAYETLSDPNRRSIYDHHMYSSDQERSNKKDWRCMWQKQVSELKRRSINRDPRGNMSCAARMRRQRNQHS